MVGNEIQLMRVKRSVKNGEMLYLFAMRILRERYIFEKNQNDIYLRLNLPIPYPFIKKNPIHHVYVSCSDRKRRVKFNVC